MTASSSAGVIAMNGAWKYAPARPYPISAVLNVRDKVNDFRTGSRHASPAARHGSPRAWALFMHRTGISNRESGDDEARERREHPPVDPASPPPEDAGGDVGEAPLSEVPQRHTSHKAGSRSIAQKEDESRYPDRSM